MAKVNYYNIKPTIDASPDNTSIFMLLGQRANGKSYQVKKLCLEEAFNGMENGTNKFMYLRRWKEDIKQDSVSSYFNDAPVAEITNGKYSGVTAYHGYIYFTYIDDMDDEPKVKRAEPAIGQYWSLNERERAKSLVFKGFKNMIYEEFITDKLYLSENEPSYLMQYMSSVFRHEAGRVFLVGNTLSRVCPYFSEWSLEPVLKMKPGELHIFRYKLNEDDPDEDDIIMAVEYCQNANYKNKMFFGQTAKQIISGEWETRNAPKLPKRLECYEKVYELMIEYQSFKFILQLLIDSKTGGIITYIYPLTSKRKILRIITERFSDNPFISARLDLSKKPEALIDNCFKTNKVCYSDNLTATDFKHVTETFKIGNVML